MQKRVNSNLHLTIMNTLCLGSYNGGIMSMTITIKIHEIKIVVILDGFFKFLTPKLNLYYSSKEKGFVLYKGETISVQEDNTLQQRSPAYCLGSCETM
jgi:hypothetical protein